MSHDPTLPATADTELEEYLSDLPDSEYVERKELLALSWSQLLSSKYGRAVVEDLRRVCRPERSVLGENRDRTHVRIGHHEVWLFVLHRLGLTYDQLCEKLAAAKKEENS